MSDFYKLSVAKLQEQLADFKQRYVSFVIKNPEAVAQIERTVKTSSYLVEALSTNYETSIFISELVTSACNLFSYANSRVLLNSKRLFNRVDDNQIVEKIKQLLLVIEVSQAFVEISAGRIGGAGAKWAVILIICLIKALLRCLLIFLFQTGIQSNSLVTLLQSKSTEQETGSKTDQNGEADVIYIGSRTGHRMKTLASLSSSQQPSFSGTSLSGPRFLNCQPTALTDTEKIGECLHAIRPLLHVLATGVCKSNSFVPWLLALITDASSHVLLQRAPQSSVSTLPSYNFTERSELRRRYANLAYYLLRSPIYEKYTDTIWIVALAVALYVCQKSYVVAKWKYWKKLMKLFGSLNKNIPLARYIFEPLAKYLPEWQKIYFYVWAD